ncbi:MAG: hypothetical protein CMJ18_10965 [Phycisphaeraceae bacterium]|nr:hypothetical protein [Phycisphaeraceae bacterium]
MRCPPPSSNWFSTLLLINRVPLGLMFVLAAFNKILTGTFGRNLMIFADRVAKQAPLPRPLGLAYGFALPWIELLAGLCLVLGFFGRIAAALIGLMLLSFMIAMGIIPDGPSPFDKNVILLTLSIFLVATGSGTFSLDALLVRTHRPGR